MSKLSEAKPNPYKLPDGNVQIAFSGGRTSGMLLHNLAKVNDLSDPRVSVIFTNTGLEMEETLDFVSECASRFSVKIIWLEYCADSPFFEEVGHNSASRKGEPFRALIKEKKYLPNAVTRFCTIELKIRTAKKYLVSIGWNHWTTAIGFRFDEQHRINLKPTKEQWVNWYPLNEHEISKADVVKFWRHQPFDLALENVKGKTPLGNCDGCFLKSEKILAGLYRDFPDRAKWWTETEDVVSDLANKKSGATFNKSYTRKSLHDFIDRQGDWLLSDEGILCQNDSGECGT